MPQIGPLEVLLVGVIALIVFGPQRLPEIARSVGKTISEFKRQAGDIRAEFESGLNEPEDERPAELAGDPATAVETAADTSEDPTDPTPS